MSQIPSTSSLTLAFLDPYGLHLSFESVRKLSTRKADLIIFFPDHLDALRNWSHYYLDQEQSNLDTFLGIDTWRSSLSESNSTRHPELLRQLYEDQLKTLGYKYFDYQRINAKGNRPLYRLIFASGHKMGLNIWRNVAGKDIGGQSSFGWVN